MPLRKFPPDPFLDPSVPQPPALDPRFASTDPIVSTCELNGSIFIFTQLGQIWKMTTNPLTLTQIHFP
jgi:hypothetical protein